MVCVCRYLKVPMGNMGVFDPTEIHNRGQLKSHMKEAMIKLGYHLLCFFIYLYRWEHWNTWKKSSAWNCFFSHVMSCSSPPAWSWLWSTTEAHRTPQLSDHHPVQSAPTNLLVECNQISVQPAVCAATNSTLWPSWSLEYLGQSTAVILTKKRSRQKAISQKRAKFLLSSLLLCRAVIF